MLKMLTDFDYVDHFDDVDDVDNDNEDVRDRWIAEVSGTIGELWTEYVNRPLLVITIIG